MQDREYLAAHSIMLELEAKVARLEAEAAEETTPELEAKIARLQAKLAAKLAAMPPAPPEPVSHTAPATIEATINGGVLVTDENEVTVEKPTKKSRTSK